MLVAITDKLTLDSLRTALEVGGVAAIFEIPGEEVELTGFVHDWFVDGGDEQGDGGNHTDPMVSLYIPAYTCDMCGRAAEAWDVIVGIGGVLCTEDAIATGQYVEFDGFDMFGPPPAWCADCA